MDDIVPELLNKILDDFRNNISNNNKINQLQNKLNIDSATYTEANEYAAIISSIMKDSYSRYMKSDNLPDGKCYYNIANRIITASEHEQYELIADFAEKVQQSLNKKSHIGIRAQRPDDDNDAVSSLINVASNAEQYDNVAKSVAQSVERMGHNVIDRSVKKNAEFQARTGLNPKIIRKTDGTCCEWCTKIAGIYDYPDNVPADIYKRHNNCSCTVEYDPGSGRRQNIWNKQWRDETESDRIENRKLLGLKREKNKKYSNNAKEIEYFKIQDASVINSITPEDIISAMQESPIGKEYLDYMSSNRITPILVYGKKYGGIRGEQRGNTIKIFVDNNKNSLVASQTLIHELTHYRFDIGGCQWAEAVCMAHEKMHKEKRNYLTADEKRYIVKLAKDAYPEYEWKKGGYHGNKRF